jgi:peptidyl-prolyl cis-trans isomerase SurA
MSLSFKSWRVAAGLLICVALAAAAPKPIDPAPPAATEPFSLPTVQAAQAPTGQEQRIAALVNDEVISYFDLDQRMKLVVSSLGYLPGAAERQQFAIQVLRSLVDEKLKWQEAKRLEVKVDNKEIVEQLQYIAQRSNGTVDDFQKDLEKRGISVYTLTDQIKVELAWNKLVEGRFGPDAKVSDADIDQILNDARANLGKPQYDVMELVLPVDSPRDDQKVLETARGLIAEMHKGAPFPKLAQQFSQAPSAAGGGSIGWVTQGQLAPVLDQWLQSAHRGSLSPEPLRTVAGYYILAIRDTRNVASGPSTPQTPLYLKRIVVPLAATASPDRARQLVEEMKAAAARVHGCNTLDEVVKSIPGAKVVDVGTKPLTALEPRDQARVVRLVSGQASEAGERTNEGFDMIVLCGHAEEHALGVPTKEEVSQRLFDQQLSMLSRRYLRDLRRDAVIDNRLGDEAN